MARNKVTKKDLEGRIFITTLDDEELDVDAYFDPSDFVSPKKNQIFVRHDPLLRVAKEVMGIIGKKVEVNQTPNIDNEWSATVTVTYKFGDDEKSVFWGATADCRKSNSRGGFARYTTAMAETRASARALRFALGVEFCSAEEIADLDEEDTGGDDFDNPIEEAQLTIIKEKMFKQFHFTIDDVNKITKKQFKREVELLDELTKGEAALVIQSLHRRKKPIDTKKTKATPKPKARTRD